MVRKKKIKEVIVFENGTIAVTDENGEQIVELQREIQEAKKHLWWKR